MRWVYVRIRLEAESTTSRRVRVRCAFKKRWTRQVFAFAYLIFPFQTFQKHMHPFSPMNKCNAALFAASGKRFGDFACS